MRYLSEEAKILKTFFWMFMIIRDYEKDLLQKIVLLMMSTVPGLLRYQTRFELPHDDLKRIISPQLRRPGNQYFLTINKFC
jgi:hypothetical protein